MPQPRHILIQKDENGEFQYEIFRERQGPEDILKILGY